MRCPKCSNQDSKVIDSRAGKNSVSIRRRRECLECNHRFTTVEEILREDLTVVKRDGTRVEFDSSKILKGVRKATEKRPIPLDDIENLVQSVCASLQEKFDSEIPSKAIGEEIIDKLKSIDQIAYVRFASVYKDFRDISELKKEIDSLKS